MGGHSKCLASKTINDALLPTSPSEHCPQRVTRDEPPKGDHPPTGSLRTDKPGRDHRDHHGWPLQVINVIQSPSPLPHFYLLPGKKPKTLSFYPRSAASARRWKSGKCFNARTRLWCGEHKIVPAKVINSHGCNGHHIFSDEVFAVDPCKARSFQVLLSGHSFPYSKPMY
jgi:hypothetical protein